MFGTIIMDSYKSDEVELMSQYIDDLCSPMDLDTTIKVFTLTHEAILSIFKDVCAIQIDDDVQFEVVGVADIRETDDYPGIRVSLKANYPPISVPLTVDVTTGDMITPREIEYTF